jgi:thymidylate kinase
VIEGVLIEGVDFVGKTTVSRRLVQALVTEGQDAALRQCYMSGSPLVRFLDEEAKRYDSMLVRDRYYSAAIVLDLQLARPSDAFLVQDRHWLSQLGRNRFFHPEEALIPAGYLEQTHVPFRHNVLLVCDIQDKHERTEGRAVKSPRDRYLRENPAIHQAYEEFLRSLIPSGEDWIVLDTTGRNVEEVVQELRTSLGSFLPS